MGHGDGQPALPVRQFLHLDGPAPRHRGPQRLGRRGRQSQRPYQGVPVMRIVGVRPHPAVRRPPEPRQRREVHRLAPRHPQVPLADECGGHGPLVHHQRFHLVRRAAGPYRGQLRRGQRARAHGGPRQLPYGQRPLPQPAGAPVGHPPRQLVRPAECAPGLPRPTVEDRHGSILRRSRKSRRSRPIVAIGRDPPSGSADPGQDVKNPFRSAITSTLPALLKNVTRPSTTGTTTRLETVCPAR